MLTPGEFEDLLADGGKRIEGDIVWAPDSRHPGAMAFRAEVVSDAGYPLFVAGWHNPRMGKLSYALIHRQVGRIYALDLGADHPNPDGQWVGDKHKHHWTPGFRDRFAYAPSDITEPWHRPAAVWRQFCAEARIEHRGMMTFPN